MERTQRLISYLGLALVSIFFTSCAAPLGNLKTSSSPSQITQYFELQWEAYWVVDVPKKGRFDASGLVMMNQELFTVNDRGPELFRINLAATNATLEASGLMAEPALRKLWNGHDEARFDTEGIALHENGTLYICEESRRAVYSWTPSGKAAELRLSFGSATQYFAKNFNASFEGIAVSKDQLFLANEREQPRVLVLDLATGVYADDFYVQPAGFALGGSHYSDLAFHDGSLFILDRNYRCILQVDPQTKRTIAQYNFAKMEQEKEVDYKTDYPTGTMEGLAVTADYFYLITDNNGLTRKAAKGDFRPTLFKVKRPLL